MREKFDSDGSRSLLFDKPVTFQDLINKKEGSSKLLAEAFFRNNFKMSDVVGRLQANLAAKIQVHVPLMSYGLTDKLTLAVAVPYYDAYLNYSDLQFKTTEHTEKLLAALSGEDANQIKEAREARQKFSAAVDKLKQDMANNGYQELESWQGRGVGDIVLAAKYRFYDKPVLKLATSNGMTLPTGRVADPDILDDMPFGVGATGLFSSLICDQQVSSSFLLNEYVKGTTYLPAEKEIRMVTASESIAVPKRRVSFKSGGKVEAGFSGQYESSFGLNAGLGLVHETKFKDSYDLDAKPEVKEALEKDTDYHTNHMVAKLSYSTLPAFKRKQVPVPVIASVEYRKQFMSAQAKAKDLLTVDLAMFF